MRLTRNSIIPFLSGLLLLMVGSVVIFYHYLTLPSHLAWDEFDFAKLALSLNGKPYTPYSTLATGHSTLYFYLLLLFLKLFGITTFGLRFPAALFSLGSIIVLYLIFRTIFKNNLIAFVSTGIFLTTRWFINFSRFAFEAPLLLFLELVSLYAIIRSDKKKTWAIMLSGVFAGLAFNSYTPGRIFFLVPLIFLLVQKQFKKAVVFMIVFGLFISPLAFYLIRYPDTRVDTVAVKKVTDILTNIKLTAQMFVTEGDWNGRHNYPGKPAINIILFLFSFTGLILAIKNIKSKYHLLFVTYFVASLIPALLTITTENPNMLRTFTVLPSLVFFVGLVLVRVLKIENANRKKFILAIAFCILLGSSLYEVRDYFVYQSRVVRNSFELTCPLNEMISYTRQSMPKRCLVRQNLF